MKKIFCLLLCLSVAVLALVGCGGNATNNNSNNPNTPNNTDPNSGVQETKTITIGIPSSALVLDYDTNAYTLWLEEVSGYNIEFIPYAYAGEDHQKQLSTETAANQKLPDILWRFTLNDEAIEQYGEDGYFIDLSPYFNDREKSANWWYMVEKYLSPEEQEKAWLLIHSAYRENIGGSLEDVPIYSFPTVETTLIDTMDFMPMINQEWLDTLKLQAPTNLQELKQVLIAFRDGDPNGNGAPDEIPMLGSKNTIGGGMIEWIINFFLYYDDAHFFNLDANGNLYAPQTTDEYRNALKYLRELVAEGLLSIKTLTYSYNNLRTVLQNTDTVGVTVNHPSLVFTSNSDAIKKWQALDLFGNAYDNANYFNKNVFITDGCADPDAAWDLLMHMCTEESAYRMRYGEKGVDWDDADPGSVSCMGLPATIKVYNDIWNTTSNQSWMCLAGGVFPYSENEQNQVTGEESEFMQNKYRLYNDLRTNFDKAKEKVNTSQVCPLLRFNAEEDEIAKTRSDAIKAVSTWRAYFLDGTKDINNNDHWNEYIRELEKAGINAYRDAATMCYNRMYKSGT